MKVSVDVIADFPIGLSLILEVSEEINSSTTGAII